MLELLLVAAFLALLALVAVRGASRSLAAARLESAVRRLVLGLEQGRTAAERTGRPCALELGEAGWEAPRSSPLPACPGVAAGLGGEGGGAGGEAAVQLEHNLPAAVRFSINGLVLDGGTVLVRTDGAELVRCLVLSLPLGVVRLGRWEAGSCQPDALL
ncbi:MAG: prepilin-type cleavage/methylation domain-containing protein [Cyanobium sp.]